MRTASSSPNTGVLAFKPRQVLLSSSSTMKKTTKSDEEPQKTLTLKPRQKTLLLQSIAQYLERNSFSKTLKKFRSEAQIEKDDLKGPSLDLEELCCKYLEMCDHSNTNVYGEKDQDAQEKKSTGSKKTKLKTDNAMTEPNLKSKEKKKSKQNSDSVDQVELRESPVDVPDLSQLDEPNKKHKDKKKKNKEVDNVERCAPQPDDTENAPKALTSEDKSSKSKKNKKQKDDNEKSSLIDSMKDVNMTIKEDANDKKSKGSKKRKRIESEGNDCQLFNEKTVDESKRKKAENLEDANGTKQPMDSNASGRGDKHADKESNLMSSANGNLEGNGTNSDMKSSAKKHASDSAQAKKPFQRVNVEEVVFTDERLQDNSYWAKDGAEAGYGAKAQEVLGQVRGRDFRHEKTKKKRGSYRGGQIDMQSHSIKFNYSDDE